MKSLSSSPATKSDVVVIQALAFLVLSEVSVGFLSLFASTVGTILAVMGTIDLILNWRNLDVD